MNYVRSRQPWYQAYCAAMLQTDENKVFNDIEYARKTIQDRVAEVSFDSSGSNHEGKELQEALHYLTMLLDCCWRERTSSYSASQRFSSSAMS
jgi:hypothetical protein